MRLIDADEIENKAVPMDSYDGFWSGTAVKLSVIRKSPTIDAVPVVRCEKCVLHGNCVTEDAFVLAGIENPFCCAGKRKEGAD